MSSSPSQISIAAVAADLGIPPTSVERLRAQGITTFGEAAEYKWIELAKVTQAPEDAAALIVRMWDHWVIGRDGPPQAFKYLGKHYTHAVNLRTSAPAMALLMHDGMIFGQTDRPQFGDITKAAQLLRGPDYLPRPGFGMLLNSWHAMQRSVPPQFAEDLARANSATVAHEVRERLLKLGTIFIPGMATQLPDRPISVRRFDREAAEHTNAMNQLAITVGRIAYLSQLAIASLTGDLDNLIFRNKVGSVRGAVADLNYTFSRADIAADAGAFRQSLEFGLRDEKNVLYEFATHLAAQVVDGKSTLDDDDRLFLIKELSDYVIDRKEEWAQDMVVRTKEAVFWSDTSHPEVSDPELHTYYDRGLGAEIQAAMRGQYAILGSPVSSFVTLASISDLDKESTVASFLGKDTQGDPLDEIELVFTRIRDLDAQLAKTAAAELDAARATIGLSGMTYPYPG